MSHSFAGTCAFRLMPYDELVEEPSALLLDEVGPTQVLLRYTWTHPEDGPQHGVLLIGGPEEDATAVTAALADSWHQKPGLMSLTGDRLGDSVVLSSQYAGDWGWEVTVAGIEGDEPTMTMRNVVPVSALATLPADGPHVEAGPYDVMVARWRRT